MINHVTLGGNITKDIEMRYTTGGAAVASFSIANNRRYTQNGEKKQEVSFINCSAFGKTAELMQKYLGKGSQVLVEGRLKQDSWEQDGQKRTAIKLIVEKVHFVGKRQEETPADRAEKAESKEGFDVTRPDSPDDAQPAWEE